MDNLFAAIFVISLVILIFGMINPNLVIRWGDKNKRNKKSVLKYYGTILIASFILFGITTDSTSNENLEVKSVEQKSNLEKTNENILPKNLEHNTNTAVDAIISKARSDAKNITEEQSKVALDYIRDNFNNYFKDNLTMEYTMYYGALLEYSSEKNSTIYDLGMDSVQAVKYVYRGLEKVEDEATQANLNQIKKSLDKL